MSEALHADVVVVGTGAGGSTIAGEALRAGRSVILIEAGAPTPGRPGYHMRNDEGDEDRLNEFAEQMGAELVNQSGIEEGMDAIPGAKTAHVVGGRMRVWFNNCPTPDGPERNAAIPAEDWPELLGRARALLHVNQETGRDSLREKRLLERVGALFPDLPPERGVQPMPLAAELSDDGEVRFAGADDLLLGDADELPDTVAWMTGTVARRILHERGRVTGLEVYPAAGGEKQTVSGGAYVIAGGTLGTPQLLTASGVECGAALGRYIMEHPLFASRVPIDPELLEGVPDDDPSYTVWIPYSESRPWHQQISRTPYLPDFLDYRARDTGDLLTFCGTEPRPENRLVYGEQLDNFELPRFEAEFSISENDREVVADAIRDHWMIATQFGEYHRGWAPQLFEWGASTHLMGSYRMGDADDGTSVTDSHSKAWGYDNLYLAGNGLFSDKNTCNPSLQTTSFALRCSDAILGRVAGQVTTAA
ncbi:MAG: GMC oxidoreductase [Solirubrobacterales bacterium]